MTDKELQALTSGMAPAVKTLVTQAITGLEQRYEARLLALEQRQAIPGRDGRDGAPGTMGERGTAGEKGLDGNHGKDGAPGINGKDGIDGQIGPMGPQGEKGIDGAHGTNGADGAVGPAGPQGPQGDPGRDGKDGADGSVGPQGMPGERGLDGKDGAAGIHGKDGTNGRDGIDFTPSDLMSLALTGERTLTWTFQRDGVSKTFDVSLPGLPIYRDVYVEGKAYEPGDMVTWGGSVWMAKDPTVAKPNLSTTESRAWRLVVKAGKDGRVGPQGPSGKDGKDGRAGADLTSILPDGTKYR